MPVTLLGLFLMFLPVLASAQVTQEELQIAVRRYMQCQADNVGMYNVQVQLLQNKVDQLQAKLDAAKKELEQLKVTKKDE